MNSLNPLQNSASHGVRANDSGLAQSLRNMGESAAAMGKSLVQGSELMAQRVDNLSKATTQMAADFIGQFAQQMFGDQAKGMTIAWDEISLSAASNFSAMQQSSQSAQGSTQASAFRLSDASQFIGKGTLTTADGQRFDIEVEIRYESVIQGASIAQQSNQGNAYGAIPDDQAAASQPWKALSPLDEIDVNQNKDSEPSRPSSPLPPSAFNQNFAGTAVDLLKRLSSEPVFQPFALLNTDTTGNKGMSLLGEMALQLLNLPGGPRYLDMSPDHNPEKKVLDAQA